MNTKRKKIKMKNTRQMNVIMKTRTRTVDTALRVL